MMTEKPIKAEVSATDNKIYLHGTIGDDWDGVTLDQVRRVSNNLDKNKVTVYINSYGGDATEGVAIRNYLKNTFDDIDVVIEGIAASAASVIATCGNTLTMPSGTTYMIHNPWTYVIGNKSDLQKEIGALESLEQSYRDIYMERFTGSEEELMELLENESWLTAEQAEVFGFATSASKEQKNDETQDSLLVATLLNKYSAKADNDIDEADDSIDGETEAVNDDNEDKPDKTENELEQNGQEKGITPNTFLSNLVKTFNV